MTTSHLIEFQTGYYGATGDKLYIDSSKWSPRLRQKIVTALLEGVACAGAKTCRFIEELTRSYGSTVPDASHDLIRIDMFPEDERDDLLAYTVAWVKLKLAANAVGGHSVWRLKHWLKDYEMQPFVRGGKISIPIPAETTKGRADFLKSRLVLTPHDRNVRAALIAKIDAGETLTIYANLDTQIEE